MQYKYSYVASILNLPTTFCFWGLLGPQKDVSEFHKNRKQADGNISYHPDIIGLVRDYLWGPKILIIKDPKPLM